VDLLRDGAGRSARKVGEEAVELVVAALSEDDQRVVEESADLWFHMLVLLASRGIDPSLVEDELRRRE
jgi:phosphoribosyl-ATP pyrophosphohydrolase